MLIIFILSILFLISGMIEQANHCKRLKKIPIRIHVNGTRGKSTTTRLIAAGLREAGFKVLAKTTGTLPQFILEDGTEVPIKRRGNANIVEQLKTFTEAAKRKVNVLVVECMAISPELQWVSEHKMVKSTIGVITNVRQDHLEEIGSEPDDMAEALKLTIPQNGILVTAERDYLPIFQKQAGKLNTKVVQTNPDNISNKIMEKFNYMNFKENVSIALRVNKLLGVDEEVALRGILKASPDPGALKIYELAKGDKIIFFINAFAANERTSALLIWENINKKTYLKDLPAIGIMNSREDRVLRNIQFAHLLAEEMNFSKILLVGPQSKLVERTLLKLKVSPNKIINLSGTHDIEKILQLVLRFTENKVLLIGFGNTKGMGQKFIEYFNEFGEEK